LAVGDRLANSLNKSTRLEVGTSREWAVPQHRCAHRQAAGAVFLLC